MSMGSMDYYKITLFLLLLGYHHYFQLGCTSTKIKEST